MATRTEDRLARARTGQRESKTLEFKGEFDPSDTRHSVELVKDLVAIANSGGGVIVVGAQSNGIPSKADVSKVLALDPEELTDKLHRYTGEHFGGFEIHEYGVRRAGWQQSSSKPWRMCRLYFPSRHLSTWREPEDGLSPRHDLLPARREE